jgi:nucleoside-diphosphate-sugar epimerase
MRDDESERHAVPEQTFAWVHVTDLAAFAADNASGQIRDGDDPAGGPVAGACVPVNVATGAATMRDYVETVTSALGVEPVWDDRPAWTGRVLADRARAWGWAPSVDLDQALDELAQGLRRGA